MKIKVKTLKRLILVIFLLVAGLALAKNILTPNKLVAIVHNDQDIGRFYDICYKSKVDIIEINTPYMSDDEINSILDMADGVIFAGGNDFDPSLYGGDSDKVGDFDPEEDRKSLLALDKAIEKNKHILGICRGMQLINIYYGGSLYEDIPSQYSEEITHKSSDEWMAHHDISVDMTSHLGGLCYYPDLEVNSYHHEGIKNLADGLVASAKSPDGIIEAIENPYYPYMLAVQWHPEISYYEDDLSQAIFDDFIAYIRK